MAGSWGRANLGPGDAVVLTLLEHHANIVPWQMLAAEKGFEIRWIPATADGRLDLSGSVNTASTAPSSSLSPPCPTSPVPSHRLIRWWQRPRRPEPSPLSTHASRSPTLPTDVVRMGADFVAFSSHKMLGPTGIGVLWGRYELLDAMPPFLGGGGMILNVTTDGFVPDKAPGKFEAGTPPIAEAVGLAAAIDYLEHIGMENIRAHEVSLTAYALRKLTSELGEDLVIHGPAEPAARGGVLSLELRDVHAHDVSQVLDEHAVCIRPGHHCAKPLMKHLGVAATARASLYVYNDEEDVDALAAALTSARDFFAL